MTYVFEGKDPSADNGTFTIIIFHAPNWNSACIEAAQRASLKGRDDLFPAILNAKITSISSDYDNIEEGHNELRQ